MNRIEKIQYLNQILLEEMPEYQETAAWFPRDREPPSGACSAAMNVRPPIPASRNSSPWDALLSEEREERGVVDVGTLPPSQKESPAGLMAGRYNHIESRRHRQCSKSAPAKVPALSIPVLIISFTPEVGIQLRLCCDEIMTAQGV